MNYLLDTHTILWATLTPFKLSETAKAIILDPGSKKYASVVSAWEVAIKLGTGKLAIEGGLPEFYRMIDTNGFISLGVERGYLNRSANLVSPRALGTAAPKKP
jgi:PIN domain nuclease of toxin-antitoxin system